MTVDEFFAWHEHVEGRTLYRPDEGPQTCDLAPPAAVLTLAAGIALSGAVFS